MMKTFDVNISVPSAEAKSDMIQISGVPNNVEAAKVGLGEKVNQLKAEMEEYNFKSQSEKSKTVKRKSQSHDEESAKKTRDSSTAANSEMKVAAEEDQEPKDSRPKEIARKHKVMFCGFVSEEDAALVEELGGSMTEEMAECSVLVADAMKRTVKLMCMAAKGVPIVSNKWLEESRASRKLLEPWHFIMRDSAKEKKWGCQLEYTLKKAAKKRILAGAVARA